VRRKKARQGGQRASVAGLSNENPSERKEITYEDCIIRTSRCSIIATDPFFYRKEYYRVRGQVVGEDRTLFRAI
jgi:hypothetical protein